MLTNVVRLTFINVTFMEGQLGMEILFFGTPSTDEELTTWHATTKTERQFSEDTNLCLPFLVADMVVNSNDGTLYVAIT